MLGDGSVYNSVTEDGIEDLSDDTVSSPAIVEQIVIWSFSVEVAVLNVTGQETLSPVGISTPVGSSCGEIDVILRYFVGYHIWRTVLMSRIMMI